MLLCWVDDQIDLLARQLMAQLNLQQSTIRVVAAQV
jgi:hypothetical protein